jgi:cation:H+ antiporter
MNASLWQWLTDEAQLNHFMSGLPTIALAGAVVLCILVLSKGADWMIDGVVALAQRTGMPRIVIGATILSLGTTTPEAFVSVMAAWMGNPGLSLGNGVGSIIADTGLIFGLTCLIAKVPINRFILNRTGWVQVGVATLLVFIALILLAIAQPPIIPRAIGVAFLVLLGLYMYAAYRWARQGGALAAGDEERETHLPHSLMGAYGLTGGGLVMVIGGARLLIPTASVLALRLGVPDDVIAATLVALGTSLPELMTAIAAIRKGHPEITVGNIVGADVLNCLFVIGASAAARPLAIPDNFYYFHFPAMLIILWSFRAFISYTHSGSFHRWQGAWLLFIYTLYILLQYGLNLAAPG